jgi:3-hydroxymyristoyl/3-hydroxydecanoyl-(acyl carrier protein) dehydratase
METMKVNGGPDERCDEAFCDVKLVEKTESPGKKTAIFELGMEADCPYFQGHFPGFAVLPAVAQTDIAVRLADRAFGTGLLVERIKRVKFSAFVLSGAVLRITLEYAVDKNRLSFKISTPEADKVFSTGTLDYFMTAGKA